MKLTTTAGARKRATLAGIVLLSLGLVVSTYSVAAGKKDNRSSNTSWEDASARKPVGYAPDPTPIRSSVQWVLTFQYRRGEVEMLRAQRVHLRSAVTTPRRIGRYAVELLSGPTVIERLRFDFPLLGADELAGRRGPYHTPPRFETKAMVVHRVMLPDTSRASRARLIDRATGQSFMIPWPPTDALKPATPKVRPADDAGHDAGHEAGHEAGHDAGSPKARGKR